MAHTLQSEVYKVCLSNFVKFLLQSMSSKIKRAFEKTQKNSIKIRLKRTLIRQQKRTITQCNISYMRKEKKNYKNLLPLTMDKKNLIIIKLLSNFLAF